MRPRHLIAALALKVLCWGAVQPSESRHIVGGTQVANDEYPWVAQIVPSEIQILCTGSLVHPE